MKIPSLLTEKISKGKIVIFAGAGLSMNVDLPSWFDLINNILDEIKENEPKSAKLKDSER